MGPYERSVVPRAAAPSGRTDLPGDDIYITFRPRGAFELCGRVNGRPGHKEPELGRVARMADLVMKQGLEARSETVNEVGRLA